MLFNSFDFIVFLILFYISWFFLKKKRLYTLLIFSLIFYGWWDARFILLIFISGLIDYVVSLVISSYQEDKKRKLLLAVSVITNLSILFFFKYTLLILSSLNSIFEVFNLGYRLKADYNIILPVGISFYTFQSMSYTIDVYRRELKAEKSFLKFFCYISMFPQLVAGPIVRAKDVLSQLEDIETKEVNEEQKFKALILCLKGFFKKMVIADNLAPYVDRAFDTFTYASSSLDWIIVMIAFALQIYFDFSGYSDIAIGLAKSIGITFQENFQNPYISKSLTEFWRRWHISLSTWFRDYVYIPLGGNQQGFGRTLINIFVTFSLSGLWHGASWNFMIWGMYHGLFLILERFSLISLKNHPRLGWLKTMVIVLIGWVFFRANSFSQSLAVIKKVISFNYSFHIGFGIFIPLLVGLIFEFLDVRMLNGSFKLKRYFRSSFVIAFCIFIIIFFRGKGEDFIYFQF